MVTNSNISVSKCNSISFQPKDLFCTAKMSPTHMTLIKDIALHLQFFLCFAMKFFFFGCQWQFFQRCTYIFQIWWVGKYYSGFLLRRWFHLFGSNAVLRNDPMQWRKFLLFKKISIHSTSNGCAGGCALSCVVSLSQIARNCAQWGETFEVVCVCTFKREIF